MLEVSSILPGFVLKNFQILLFFSFLFSGIIDDAEKSIIASVPVIDSLFHQIIPIPNSLKTSIGKYMHQSFFRDELHIWAIYQSDSLSNIAVLDNVIGKSMPITFLVIFNLDRNIIHADIIKYREPYGGEISSPRWLGQFKQKNDSSSFRVGLDIDGISGATISVNSVSRGIQKLALLTPYLIENLTGQKE